MTTRDEGGKDDDADLRAAFGRMRSEDAAAAPAFDRVLTAAASRHAADRRRPWPVPTLAGTLAAAAVVAAVIAVARRPEPRLPAMASIEQWTAPTDFLLVTPGRELLEEVPRIGELPRKRSMSP